MTQTVQAGEKLLTIGKLAQLVGVSAHSLRFYEREGLMKVPAKSDNGYRHYRPETVRRLRFIKQAQQCAFTLAEIQNLLKLQDEPSSCCGDVRGKVIEKKFQLEARIKAMREVSKALDRLIEICNDSSRPTQDCAIIAMLSNAMPQVAKPGKVHCEG